ncbi:glycosyltransferase [Campylobacter coli]|nr:glycosyltransferase [Campylobacter coli]
MNKKRILFLSIVPPLPKNQGNRLNTFSILKYLINQGFFIDFLMYGGCLQKEIYEEFGENIKIHVNASEVNLAPKYRNREILKKNLKLFLNDHSAYKHQIKEMFYTVNSFHPFEFIGNNMINKASNLLSKYNYDFIFCSYLFTMKIVAELKHLIKSPVVLITHDAHSQLNKIAFSYDIDTQYRACMPDVEAEVLNMADKVIAITNDDKSYFESIGVYKKIIVSEFSCFDNYKKYKFHLSNFKKKVIFYCASDNPSNYMAITRFLYRVWPCLVSLDPGIKMVICGTICRRIENKYKNIKILGELEHDKMIENMSNSTIGINPVFWGTGLKIKSVEYMSIGLPFVSFNEGVSGLSQFNNEAFMVAEDWVDFGKKIVILLNDEEKWINMSKRARDIAENRFIDSMVFKDVL